MIAEYHVKIAKDSLEALGFVHKDNVAAIAAMAESPDNFMRMSKVEFLTIMEYLPASSGGPSFDPQKPHALTASEEHLLIDTLLNTKLAYRIKRIQQIGSIDPNIYTWLFFALHRKQEVLACCAMIDDVLATDRMRPITIPRLLANYSHFFMDSITPVHQYLWSNLLQANQDAAGLIDAVGAEMDLHTPYETDVLVSGFRYESDLALMTQEFRRLAEIPDVRAALVEPMGFIGNVFSDKLSPVQDLRAMVPKEPPAAITSARDTIAPVAVQVRDSGENFVSTVQDFEPSVLGWDTDSRNV
jgi:hypothetical protein